MSFNLARFIGGVGIGLASNLSPMYIAEISPAEMRGRFVSINQLTIVIGILAAQVVNWLIAQHVADGAAAEIDPRVVERPVRLAMDVRCRNRAGGRCSFC